MSVMDSPPQRILTINQGSSSLKAALYEISNGKHLLLSMTVAQGRESHSRLTIFDGRNATLFDQQVEGDDPDGALAAIFGWMDDHNYLHHLDAAGHRLVHGGAQNKEPARITPELLVALQHLVPLDPDHLLNAIRNIEYLARRFPELVQVACFDTAFHSTLPNVARMYALPRRFLEQGVYRYGFHGLSCEYVMQELRVADHSHAEGRVIIAHLGNGASITAVQDGRSVDTSMGFTPLEGLVMGTRSGDVDAGILLYLMAQEEMSSGEIQTVLNKESGLLGVSGITGNMKDLLESAPVNECAAQAVHLFCYRVKKYIGAYVAAMGGLDVLVFTGGIGEHAPAIRERICKGLEFLGIQLDGSRNESNALVISRDDGRVHVHVMQTNEDLMVARHVLAVLSQSHLQADGEAHVRL